MKKKTVRLDEEGTSLLFEARKKILNENPTANADFYNVIKISLKKFMED